MTKLRELPITIDVDNLATGFLELFDEDERTVLRFGMLPAKKMELMERMIREKFDGLGRHPSKVWPDSMIARDEYGPDDRVSTVDGEVCEWNIKRLVSEAMHEISLGLYSIGDLVV